MAACQTKAARNAPFVGFPIEQIQVPSSRYYFASCRADRRPFDSHCPTASLTRRTCAATGSARCTGCSAARATTASATSGTNGAISISGVCQIRWSAEAFLGKGREIYILREGETLFEVLDDRHAAKESTLRHLESGPCQIHRWIVARISSTR
jgi:hypothetical protein